MFLFLRKHNEGLSPRLLGWGNFVFTLAYGVIQNVLLPLLVVIFSVYMVIVYPLKFVLALMLMLYFVYLFLSALIFVVYIGLVSERKKRGSEVSEMVISLPCLPVFHAFDYRFLNG